MADKTAIQWTEATWNPWHGCHKISPGCKFCYMFREKRMYGQDPDIVVRSKTKFNDPLRWKEPRVIFTCSWSDWFIEEADQWRDEAYEIIRRTPQHTYQILTKRTDRIAGRFPDPPLPNVWLGCSVEDQRYADERREDLLQAHAKIHFVSYEPALGPVDFSKWLWVGPEGGHEHAYSRRQMLDWIIVGGESGAGARPFETQWALNVIEQCKRADVACFVKQLGAQTLTPQCGLMADVHFPGRPPMEHVRPDRDLYRVHLKDKKGGAMEEWPTSLQVRQMPEVR